MSLHSLRSPTLLALLLVGAVVLPSPLLGQQTPAAQPGIVAIASPTLVTPAPATPLVLAQLTPAPSMLSLPNMSMTTVSLVPAATDGLNTPQDRRGMGPNVALMAAGGAGVVVGLLIGGDAGLVIASTGGVLGIIGLYRYLR